MIITYDVHGETKSFEFTADDNAFLEMLRTVVDEQPDFCYLPPEDMGCVYSVLDDGWCPSCLIGHVLIRLGVPPDWFEFGYVERKTTVPTRPNYGTSASSVMRALGYSQRAIDLAEVAQIAQDDGVSWRGVLNNVREFVNFNFVN